MVTKQTKKVEKAAWDDEANEAVSNFISFAQEGDFIYGALLAPRREVPNKLAEKAGTMQWLYEVKVHECEYHKLDKKKKVVPEAITPEAGETIVLGGKAGFDHKLANLRVGQLFGVKFVEEQEAKIAGRNPTKIFKVFLPHEIPGDLNSPVLMDEEVQAGSTFDDFKNNDDK